MKHSTQAGAALAFAVALLSGTPAIAQETGESASPGTAIDTRDDDTDWGWLGLIGLVGLAGLRRKRTDTSTLRSSSSTAR